MSKFMDTKRAFWVRLGNARNGSCFGFVAVQVMNSNRGMKGSILLQGESDSRGFKGKYDEKSNHLRNF